jgi:hypothetical protein
MEIEESHAATMAFVVGLMLHKQVPQLHDTLRGNMSMVALQV